MARPPKCRCIGGYPDFWSFSPDDESTEAPVMLSLDEFETIRSIDWLGQNQEECAQEMQIARTTVTSIYESARKKLADALVNGRRIIISGGSYRLRETEESIHMKKKGSGVMRIAVTYENGEVFQHFGHTQQFKLYDVNNGTIEKEEVVDTNGQGHGALAGFLKQAEVDTLICGGIGGGAQMALSEAGITLYAGCSGEADEAVRALIAGTLAQIGEATCDHHHGEGHNCGHHGEGHGHYHHHEGGHCGHHHEGGHCGHHHHHEE